MASGDNVQAGGTGDVREILTEALNLWWLRPENGMALASYCLSGVDLRPGTGAIAADFACGDGVNTFFKCGGRFEAAFDLFGTAVHPATSQEIVRQGIDVFAHDAADYQPLVRRKAGVRYTYGTDHKSSLLAKAKPLDFYDELLLADLREAAAIPDASLDLAYCNSLYWVGEAETAFRYIADKVKPGGRIVVDVMTDQRRLLTYDRLLPGMPPAWRDLMNRGRQHNNPGIQSRSGWERLFTGDGRVEILDTRDIFPTAIAQIWNVGLRPIFPVLNRMAQAIADERRADIKREWVEIFADLFEPVLRDPGALRPSGEAVRLQFVMRKR